MIRVNSKRAQADRAEFLVAHRDRLRRAPLELGHLIERPFYRFPQRAVGTGRNGFLLGIALAATTHALQNVVPALAIGFVVNLYQRGTASLKRMNAIFATPGCSTSAWPAT